MRASMGSACGLIRSSPDGNRIACGRLMTRRRGLRLRHGSWLGRCRDRIRAKALQTLGGDGYEENQQDGEDVHVADHPAITLSVFSREIVLGAHDLSDGGIMRPSGPPDAPRGGNSVGAGGRAPDESGRKRTWFLP